MARQCSLLYGVSAMMVAAGAHAEGLIAHGISAAVASGAVEAGDCVVAIARGGGRFGCATVQLMTV